MVSEDSAHSGGQDIAEQLKSWWAMKQKEGKWQHSADFLPFPFSLGLQPVGWYHPHSGWIFLPYLSISGNKFQSLCIINLQGISKSAQINNEDLSSPLPHIYYSLRFKWRIFFRTQLPNPIYSSDIGFHIQKYHQTRPIWSTLSHLQNLFKLFFSWVVT